MFSQGSKNRQAGPSFSAGAAQGALSKGPLVSVFGSTRGINAASQRVAVAGGTAIDTSAAGVSFVSGVQGPLFLPYGIPSTITEVTVVARVVLPTATYTEFPLLYIGGAYDFDANQFRSYIYHAIGNLYYAGSGLPDVNLGAAPAGAFDIAVSASLGPTSGIVVYVNGVQATTGTGSSITPAVAPVYACIAARPEQNVAIPSGASVGYAHAFMRALPADEIRRIHENPTGVLRKQSPFPTSVAGGADTVTCSVGAAAAAGTSATINSAQTVSCAVGGAVATGVAATISNADSVICSVGNATAAGTAAVINSAVSVDCSVGDAVAAGVTATISTSGAVTIDCGVGAAVAAGTTAGIESPISVSCSVGNAVAAGIGCTVSSNVYINCAVGDAIAVGVTATITTSGADSVDCSVGNAVAAGVSSSISGGLTLSTADIEAIADAVWAHPKALTLGKYLGLR